MSGSDGPHGGGAAVLLVVSVEDEQDVERSDECGVRLEAGLGDLPHHREEVGAEVEAVVGVDEGHPDAEAVRGSGERRHLGDQPDHLLVQDGCVRDVLGVEVEGAQRGDRGDHHPHRMGVVVEALQEALSDVLVDEGVVRDVVRPLGVLLGRRQLPVEQEVGDLEIVRLLSKLLDRVPAVAQDAVLSIEVGDG